MYVVIATKRFLADDYGAPVKVFHCANRPAAKRLKNKLKQKHDRWSPDFSFYRRVAIKPIKFVKV